MLSDRLELMTHREALLAFAKKRIPDEADDVVQRALLRALEQQSAVTDPSRARAWLFRILRNEIIDQQRSRAVRIVHEDSAGRSEARSVAPTDASDSSVCPCILTQIKTLPAADQALLESTALEGNSIAAVAKESGKSSNAMTVRVHRARRKLRDKLIKHCGTSSLRACLTCACTTRGCCATA
jgi:RNA polymerase sigma-70 factor, ECF subfamily